MASVVFALCATTQLCVALCSVIEPQQSEGTIVVARLSVWVCVCWGQGSVCFIDSNCLKCYLKTFINTRTTYVPLVRLQEATQQTSLERMAAISNDTIAKQNLLLQIDQLGRTSGLNMDTRASVWQLKLDVFSSNVLSWLKLDDLAQAT